MLFKQFRVASKDTAGVQQDKLFSLVTETGVIVMADVVLYLGMIDLLRISSP